MQYIITHNRKLLPVPAGAQEPPNGVFRVGTQRFRRLQSGEIIRLRGTLSEAQLRDIPEVEDEELRQRLVGATSQPTRTGEQLRAETITPGDISRATEGIQPGGGRQTQALQEEKPKAFETAEREREALLESLPQTGDGVDLERTLAEQRLSEREARDLFGQDAVQQAVRRIETRRALEQRGIDLRRTDDLAQAIEQGATLGELETLGFDPLDTGRAQRVANERREQRQALASLQERGVQVRDGSVDLTDALRRGVSPDDLRTAGFSASDIDRAQQFIATGQAEAATETGEPAQPPTDVPESAVTFTSEGQVDLRPFATPEQRRANVLQRLAPFGDVTGPEGGPGRRERVFDAGAALASGTVSASDLEQVFDEETIERAQRRSAALREAADLGFYAHPSLIPDSLRTAIQQEVAQREQRLQQVRGIEVAPGQQAPTQQIEALEQDIASLRGFLEGGGLLNDFEVQRVRSDLQQRQAFLDRLQQQREQTDSPAQLRQVDAAIERERAAVAERRRDLEQAVDRAEQDPVTTLRTSPPATTLRRAAEVAPREVAGIVGREAAFILGTGGVAAVATRGASAAGRGAARVGRTVAARGEQSITEAAARATGIDANIPARQLTPAQRLRLAIADEQGFVRLPSRRPAAIDRDVRPITAPQRQPGDPRPPAPGTRQPDIPFRQPGDPRSAPAPGQPTAPTVPRRQPGDPRPPAPRQLEESLQQPLRVVTSTGETVQLTPSQVDALVATAATGGLTAVDRQLQAIAAGGALVEAPEAPPAEPETEPDFDPFFVPDAEPEPPPGITPVRVPEEDEPAPTPEPPGPVTIPDEPEEPDATPFEPVPAEPQRTPTREPEEEPAVNPFVPEPLEIPGTEPAATPDTETGTETDTETEPGANPFTPDPLEIPGTDPATEPATQPDPGEQPSTNPFTPEPLDIPGTEPATTPATEPAPEPFQVPDTSPFREPFTDPAVAQQTSFSTATDTEQVTAQPEPSTLDDPLADPFAEPTDDLIDDPLSDPLTDPVPEPPPGRPLRTTRRTPRTTRRPPPRPPGRRKPSAPKATGKQFNRYRSRDQGLFIAIFDTLTGETVYVRDNTKPKGKGSAKKTYRKFGKTSRPPRFLNESMGAFSVRHNSKPKYKRKPRNRKGRG